MKRITLIMSCLLLAFACKKPLPEPEPEPAPESKTSFTVSYDVPVHYSSITFVTTTVKIHDSLDRDTEFVIDDDKDIHSGYFRKTLSYSVKDLPVTVSVHVEPVVRDLSSETFPFAFSWTAPKIHADYSTIMTPEGMKSHYIELPEYEAELIDGMKVKTFAENHCQACDYSFKITFEDVPVITPVK